MSFNLAIKKFNDSVPAKSSDLVYSFVFLKNNGFLLSSFVWVKGHKRPLTAVKQFIYSKILKVLPTCPINLSSYGELNNNDLTFSFFFNSSNLRPTVNSFYKSILAASKVWFDELELVGLGYRLTIKNKSVRFRLGFSHVIILPIPSSVFLLKRKKRLVVYSTDKASLSLFVSILLRLKKMSAYKVKGIKKKNQIFNLKPGKKRAK